jgi:predicted RNase H-like HicB family nuclease
MKEYTFKVIIERDEDKWHAYCPILEDKGASTWGETWEEALKNIKEVLAMTLASMKQHGEKIPGEVKETDNVVSYSEVPVQLSVRY